MAYTDGMKPFILFACLIAGWLPWFPAKAARMDYRLSQGVIVIEVYKDGWLASRGHNHIVHSRAFTVQACVEDGLAAVYLALPIHSLQVDDAHMRAAAGDSFASEMDARDIDKTRRRMLGGKILDAENNRAVHVRLSSAAPHDHAAATIQLGDSKHRTEIDLHTVFAGNSVRVEGEFSVNQSALGIEPFSVMLGALKVQDALRVRFEATLLASVHNANSPCSEETPQGLIKQAQ